MMNLISFYGLNFTFICVLIFMVWRIRKISEQTLISIECTVIVFIQLVFSMMQSMLNTANEIYGCVLNDFPYVNFETLAYKAQFWLIIA